MATLAHDAGVPLVHADEDWLSLRSGDQCLVRGRLHGALRPGDDALIVANTSWEMLAISLPAGHQGVEMAAGTPVAILATRGEDGIETSTDDIVERPE